MIALTHMRAPNDRRLAKEVAEIDLICGGHDHDYLVEEAIGPTGALLVKSGTCGGVGRNGNGLVWVSVLGV